jgi:hypothetical protein
MSNVHQLHAINLERCQLVQAFCADQAGHFMRLASRPDGVAAAFSVVITGDNTAETKMAAIEPEHAMAMLAELDRLRVKLTSYVVEAAPHLLNPKGQQHGGQVIRLIRG